MMVKSIDLNWLEMPAHMQHNKKRIVTGNKCHSLTTTEREREKKNLHKPTKTTYTNENVTRIRKKIEEQPFTSFIP